MVNIIIEFRLLIVKQKDRSICNNAFMYNIKGATG